MKYVKRWVFFLFVFIAYPSIAWAYIDPGAGSLFFQILIGFIFGAFFVIKAYWKSFKKFLRDNLFRRKK